MPVRPDGGRRIRREQENPTGAGEPDGSRRTRREQGQAKRSDEAAPGGPHDRLNRARDAQPVAEVAEPSAYRTELSPVCVAIEFSGRPLAISRRMATSSPVQGDALPFRGVQDATSRRPGTAARRPAGCLLSRGLIGEVLGFIMGSFTPITGRNETFHYGLRLTLL